MKNNAQNNAVSFVDETKNIKAKAKVMKRNSQLNIRNTRLRKTLQNNKLLENYFEWDKTAPSTSDLTTFKIISPACTTPTPPTTEIMTIQPISEKNRDAIQAPNRGCRIPSHNRVVTSVKVQVKPANAFNNSATVSAIQSPDSSPKLISSNISTNTSLPSSSNPSTNSACHIVHQQVFGKHNVFMNLTAYSNQTVLTNSSSVSTVGNYYSAQTTEENYNPFHLLATENQIYQSGWSVEDQSSNEKSSNTEMNDDCESFLSSISYFYENESSSAPSSSISLSEFSPGSF